MTKFRQKDFSNYIIRDALTGAAAGANIGTLAGITSLVPTKLPKFVPGHKKYDKLTESRWVQYPNVTDKKKKDGWDWAWRKTSTGQPSNNQRLLFAFGSMVLGAGLGAIVGAIRTADEKWSQSRTDRRLLRFIKTELERSHLKEGVDYTFDPKKANEISTKVCIVLSSASGDLQTVINSVNDPKLKNLVDRIVRKSPGRISKTGEERNRYNEITITTEKNASKNVKQVVSIIKSFVESGYPVYIIEVG